MHGPYLWQLLVIRPPEIFYYEPIYKRTEIKMDCINQPTLYQTTKYGMIILFDYELFESKIRRALLATGRRC